MKWLIIDFIVAFGILGYVLKWWHRKLMMYLYREHRTECEQLDTRLFDRHAYLPDWTSRGSWTWRGLRFLLCKKYERLDDPELLMRARRFRVALVVWLVTLIVIGAAALYWNPH